MRNDTGNIVFIKKGAVADNLATTGVSLHCHTLHSKEMLDFVPYYAERIPVVRQVWRREMDRRERTFGRVPDFKIGYWEPPLTGEALVDSEKASLEKLGLCAIVSITDHDSIAANLELKNDVDTLGSPISMEWTVPFENAFFHVGVHNLPEATAEEISRQLLAYTYAGGAPDDVRLTEILAVLDEIPEVLVVLNHPIWDIEMIGQEAHEDALSRFLARHKKQFHAVEVNGFRAWVENQRVIELAETLSLPVISGGDRHCCQPNTMFNLTDSKSFDEFVSEVRIDGHSRVAVTPQYHVPLPSRQLASIAQILGDHPNFPAGRRLWTDRIFLEEESGNGLTSLTEQWRGKRPLWAYAALGALRVMSHRWMRPIIAAAVGDMDIGVETTRPEVVSRAPRGSVSITAEA